MQSNSRRSDCRWHMEHPKPQTTFINTAQQSLRLPRVKGGCQVDPMRVPGPKRLPETPALVCILQTLQTLPLMVWGSKNSPRAVMALQMCPGPRLSRERLSFSSLMARARRSSNLGYLGSNLPPRPLLGCKRASAAQRVRIGDSAICLGLHRKK